jgi:hypothetical protein
MVPAPGKRDLTAGDVFVRIGEVEITVMRSTTIPRVRHRTRRATNTPAAHALARAGLTARGIIYILIGWVAVLVALGHGTHEADQGRSRMSRPG